MSLLTREIEELLRELEKSRQHSMKHKTLLQDLVRAEWKPILQTELNAARQSTFDARAVIAELQNGTAHE